MKVIIEAGGPKPHVWLAALMMTSFTLQRMLKEGYKTPEDTMRTIREMAMDIADRVQINIDYKDFPKPPEGDGQRG